MRISDWSSDVCSSDLLALVVDRRHAHGRDQIVRLATERLRQRPEVGGCWQVYAANIVRDAVSPHVLALAGLLAQKDRRLPSQVGLVPTLHYHATLNPLREFSNDGRTVRTVLRRLRRRQRIQIQERKS